MAITVENGTIVASANAYCDVAYVTAYASSRGYDFAGSDADKEASIIKATDYIDARFAFNGDKVSVTQELAWPRQGAVDALDNIAIPADAIPSTIKRAVAELACKAFGGTSLLEDQARGGRIVSQSVGDISVTYESGADVDVATKFGITGLIKGLLRDASNAPMPWSASTVDGERFSRGQFRNQGA